MRKFTGFYDTCIAHKLRKFCYCQDRHQVERRRVCGFSFAFDDTEEFGIGGQVGDDIIGLAASTDLSHFYNHRTALTYNRAM